MRDVSLQQLLQSISETETVHVFFYTAMCGTCHLAEKMLSIVAETINGVLIVKTNVNYIKEYATIWEIESVPCLITFANGKIADKIYAFQSVSFLYEHLKKI